MVTLMLVMSACGGLSEEELANAELAYNDGVDAYDQQLYPEAISHYDKAIQLDLNYAKAYAGRGSAYGETGEYQRAVEDFDKATQRDTRAALAYFSRGLAYGELGQDAKADRDKAKACFLENQYCD